jgi:hypothetical protein
MNYTVLGPFRPRRRPLVQPLPDRINHRPRHAVRPTRDPIRWLRSMLREIGADIILGFQNVLSS